MLLVDQYGRKYRTDLRSLQMKTATGRSLADYAIQFVETRNFHSQRNQLYPIIQFGRGINKIGRTEAPHTDQEWLDAIEEVLSWFVSNSTMHATLRTRVKYWNRGVVPFLRFLRDDIGIFSAHIVPPQIPQSLMGEEEEEQATLLSRRPTVDRKGKKGKLLLDVELSCCDAQFLERYAEELLHRKKILRECLCVWWNTIKEHFRYGHALCAFAEVEALKVLFDQGVRRLPPRHGGRPGGPHIANGETPASLGLLLQILSGKYEGLFSKSLLVREKDLPSLSVITFPPGAPIPCSGLIRKMERINWMLGNFSAFDVAVCCALLIMENPSFTPYSILQAKVESARGRPLLRLGEGCYNFSVKKCRARSYKTAELSDLSLDIIRTIFEMSSRRRAKLAKERSLFAESLFLTCQAGQSRPPSFSNCGELLSRASNVGERSLLTYFPDLKAEGFGPESPITFSRIRATEGTLEYFRTGSLRAVAQVLGNSVHTVLQHYLPAPLRAAWNARQIRRFQNLLIVVAWERVDGLLALTDFSSLESLHHFLRQSLLDHSASESPLSSLLHERFGELADKPEKEVAEMTLMVPVSTESLALLYAYAGKLAATDLRHPVARQKIGGVSPVGLVELSRFLQTSLPDHREAALRQAHNDAMPLAKLLVEQGGSISLLMRTTFENDDKRFS